MKAPSAEVQSAADKYANHMTSGQYDKAEACLDAIEAWASSRRREVVAAKQMTAVNARRIVESHISEHVKMLETAPLSASARVLVGDMLLEERERAEGDAFAAGFVKCEWGKGAEPTPEQIALMKARAAQESKSMGLNSVARGCPAPEHAPDCAAPHVANESCTEAAARAHASARAEREAQLERERHQNAPARGGACGNTRPTGAECKEPYAHLGDCVFQYDATPHTGTKCPTCWAHGGHLSGCAALKEETTSCDGCAGRTYYHDPMAHIVRDADGVQRVAQVEPKAPTTGERLEKAKALLFEALLTLGGANSAMTEQIQAELDITSALGKVATIQRALT